MDHKLRGFEALARMKDSDGAFISPGEFIPVAEKIGLIDKVDEMIFRKSALFFGKLLKESGVPATNLEIEITESIILPQEETEKLVLSMF